MTLVLLLGGVMLAGAAGQTEARSEDSIKGTVEFVDAQTGLLWVTLDDGSRLKVAAPTALLNHLQKGSETEILITKQETEGATGEDTAVATVQKIDSSIGLLRLLTAQDEIIDLRPPQNILADLQTGDRVKMSVRETQEPQQQAARSSMSQTGEQQSDKQQGNQQATGASTARVEPSQTSAMAIQNMPIAATVTQIDQQNQKLQLMTETGHMVEFKISESLLSALQTGDSVEVSIHKKSDGQRTGSHGSQQSSSDTSR
jgi:hypothetical protein